ncbi:MAG: bifunctional glutamate N-acetyltransferase/amino-acid acetyltransferase ArgJ [Deltaproteobacteria bacterium]|nr:bifunctional glutamate N-acetyltransferase/amino-acid acetyltransferase ArgJ [Deltaproteobacteria bacterium]
MSMITEPITVPGFLANGIHVGLKADGRRDLSLLFSTVPAKAAGMFTTNSFKAAPVLLDRERIKSGRAQAIITNSGNANAATGEQGYRDALNMSKSAAESLSIPDKLVLVASTGVIGQRLPVEKITLGMPGLTAGLCPEGIAAAEEAIMTTDKFPKVSLRKALIGNKEVTLCGLAKGAGMISPTMATMLAFFITDAEIEATALQSIFRQVVNRTFNAITVDGCMSTNDTAIIMANGVARNSPIKLRTRDSSIFREMLFSAMDELSQAIVRDGEGATKVIEVNIEGALSTAEAKKAAYAIANSNLVKTAFFGCDPNWGRIISAVGSIGINVDVEAMEVKFEDIAVFADGAGVTGSEDRLVEIMAQPHINLRVNLAAGNKKFRILTSDLGFDYVKLNAHYHT